MLDGGWEEGLLFLPSFPSRRDRDSKAWGLRERPILGVCPYVGGRVQAAYYLPSTCLTAPTPQFTVPGSPAYHTPRTHPVLTHPPSSIYTQAQASSPEIIPPLRDGAPPPPSGSGRVFTGRWEHSAFWRRLAAQWPLVWVCGCLCVRSEQPGGPAPRGPSSPSAARATAPPEAPAAAPRSL